MGGAGGDKARARQVVGLGHFAHRVRVRVLIFRGKIPDSGTFSTCACAFDSGYGRIGPDLPELQPLISAGGTQRRLQGSSSTT